MALKELFYGQRPVAMLNPHESRRMDSRWRYTRLSEGLYVDADRVWKVAPPGVPRHHHDFATGQYLGMLFEGRLTVNEAVNSTATGGGVGVLPTGWSTSTAAGLTVSVVNVGTEQGVPYVDLRVSGTVTNQELTLQLGCFSSPFPTYSVAATGETWAASCYLKRVSGQLPGTGSPVSVSLTYAILKPDGTTIRYFTPPDGQLNLVNNVRVQLSTVWQRYSSTLTLTDTGVGKLYCILWVGNVGSGDVGSAVDYTLRIGYPQMEKASKASSPIRTFGVAAATRSPDIISIDAVNIPSPGSVIVDAQFTETTAGATLVSLANASNQKINLGVESRAETYNAAAVVASYNGQAKTSLPLSVPSSARQKNIITWGQNNYQHGANVSRYSPQLAASVPSALNQLYVGRDATDTSKAFMGILNSVYLLPAELDDNLAEALVRTELSAINADTYSPAGPAGSLSLIINTQGAASDGNRVFTLPASRASTAATALVVGQTYRILTVGTSNFTLAGATTNTVGTVFVATGTTTGTGTAAWHNDIVVTWGDGTESGLEGAAAEAGAVGLTHTYSSAGIYPVWVEGRMQNIYYNNIDAAPDLVRIQAWGTGDMFRKPTTMNGAFYGCSKLDFSAAARSTNLPDTSAVTDWSFAFSGCSSITGAFPQFNYSAATTLYYAFNGCSSITSWPDVSTQTQNVTSAVSAWAGCSLLTSFPLITLSACTNFTSTWAGCSGLTSFPLINTAAGTSFAYAWSGCAGLTSFPLLNTANAVDLNNAWNSCSSLTTMPLLNTAKVTNFQNAFINCASLASIPAFNTGAATDMLQTFFNCTSLASFPAINTANVTNFSGTWYQCTSLSSFPSIDTSKGTNFNNAWYGNAISSFPALSFTSAVVGVAAGGAAVGFWRTWRACTALTTFPANMFNLVQTTQFEEAFLSCALTAASIENILVSINTAGTSNGALGLNGGTNAAKTTWTANANTAYNALVARGWTITFNA